MAQQNQQTSIPAVPRTTRMFDDHGNLTRPWLVFFERVAAQEISLPGRIQPIGGEPFVLSIQEDGKTATLTVIYDPPARLGLFTGVTAHVEAPADSGKIVLSNDYGYNGNPKAPAGSEARRGSLQIKLPQPATENQIWRVYLTECSRGYKVPLVLYGNPNTSPWATIEVSKAAASAGVAEPPAPVAVSVAEKPNSRRLAQNEEGAWVTLFTLQVTVELKSDPLPNQWVAIELSRDDKEHWDGWTHDREITSKTQTFDLDLYVPNLGHTFWARAWSRIPGYPGSAAEAVESASGVYIAGLAEPRADAVKSASVIARTRITADDVNLWGPAATWTNPTPAEEPHFWTTMLRISWVNAFGQPNPEYGEAAFEYSAEITNDAIPGKTVVHDNGQNWTFPKLDDPYPIPRFTIWVRNRAGAAVKQYCWPGGADHFDLDLSAATPAGKPPMPVGVILAEKPGSRRLAPNKDGAYVTWFALRVTVELPAVPLEGEWGSIWISENNQDWAGPWDFPITQQTQSFDIGGWVVPAHGGQYWAKATTNAPGGLNSPADAVVCATPAQIAGLGNPAAYAVTGGQVTYKERTTVDGPRLWGPVVHWINPTAEQEPNFWTTMLRVGWINQQGQPNTGYGDPEFEYSAEVTNNAEPGKYVIHDDGQNWLFPGPDDPYPIPRFTIWVRNRAGAAIKQQCWDGGADHADLNLTLPPPSLRLDRADPNSLTGLEVVNGKLQPKVGPGVKLNDLQQIEFNPGAGMEVVGEAAGVKILSTRGLSLNTLGQLEVKATWGVTFDASGNLIINADTADFDQVLGYLRQKRVDLSKAANFDTTQFEIDPSTLKMRVKSLSVDTVAVVGQTLRVGYGEGNVGQIGVFGSGGMLGWIGQNAGYFGGWFKQLYIGGNGPDSAKLVSDAFGNLSISGATITLVDQDGQVITLDSDGGLMGVYLSGNYRYQLHLSRGGLYLYEDLMPGYTSVSFAGLRPNGLIVYGSSAGQRTTEVQLFAGSSRAGVEWASWAYGGRTTIHSVVVSSSDSYADFYSLRINGVSVITSNRQLQNVTLPAHSHPEYAPLYHSHSEYAAASHSNHPFLSVNGVTVIDSNRNIGDMYNCHTRVRNSSVGMTPGEIVAYFDGSLGKCVIKYYDGANTFTFVAQ